MSGLPMDWQREDAETFGEGVSRCTRAGCNAPHRMIAALTVVVFRCDQGHVWELHSVYPEALLGAPGGTA